MRIAWRPDVEALLGSVPADFTYSPVGATRGEMPAGWRHVERTWPVASFARAAAAVLDLSVLRDVGLRVAAGSLAPGSAVLQAVPVGPVAMLAPCRVAYVLDGEDEQGFAYGTVAGHPERGEEAFLVRRTEGGAGVLTIRSFTRPGSPIVAVGWPVAGLVVRQVVGRYGAAVVRRAA